MKLFRTLMLATMGCLCVFGYVKHQWPEPQQVELIVKPIEKNVNLALALAQGGDTIRLAPDGVRRYWKAGIRVPSSTKFIRLNGGGLSFCVLPDDFPECDVVILQESSAIIIIE